MRCSVSEATWMVTDERTNERTNAVKSLFFSIFFNTNTKDYFLLKQNYTFSIFISNKDYQDLYLDEGEMESEDTIESRNES